jgi:hypothetical protein
MVKSIYEITECPQCASQNIIHNAKSLQIICKDCGLIYDPLKPVKNVGLVVSTTPSNSERIIRPVEKAISKRAKPKKPAQKKLPVKAKPQKKPAKKPVKKASQAGNPKKGIGGKIKGFMKKLMKKKR